MAAVDPRRVNLIKPGPEQSGPVLYWMSRDQRVSDNWALLYAQELADKYKSPLAVAFCMVPKFLEASWRQYHFMIEGLKEVEINLNRLKIPFYILTGAAPDVLPDFMKKHHVAHLITDFSPLKIKQTWDRKLTGKLDIPFYEADAHNIVPTRFVSDKKEFAARTIRPKIKQHLDQFLTDFPKIRANKIPWPGPKPKNDWSGIVKSLKINMSVGPVSGFKPGEAEAKKALKSFLQNRLKNYDANRNDPTLDGQSGLSPFIHFGQISAQRIALEVNKLHGNNKSRESFLEELIVRRELADNFCLYEPAYDSFNGFHDWAKKTLDDHRKDKKEYLYSRRQLELGRTHDDLWNAAQTEMVVTGKMHGFMRMYWAKKIMEWTESPEAALKTAIYLNDKYELDGRDPNGYAGITWAIGGVHDRAWSERDIFGKIRYMNYAGCKRKFDVDKYIKSIRSIEH